MRTARTLFYFMVKENALTMVQVLIQPSYSCWYQSSLDIVDYRDATAIY